MLRTGLERALPADPLACLTCAQARIAAREMLFGFLTNISWFFRMLGCSRQNLKTPSAARALLASAPRHTFFTSGAGSRQRTPVHVCSDALERAHDLT